MENINPSEMLIVTDDYGLQRLMGIRDMLVVVLQDLELTPISRGFRHEVMNRLKYAQLMGDVAIIHVET